MSHRLRLARLQPTPRRNSPTVFFWQIVSLVRGGEAARNTPGPFLKCLLRTNVLLTRARKKLFVVGTRIWREIDPTLDGNLWPAFCSHFGGPSLEELAEELGEDVGEFGAAQHDPYSGVVGSAYALREWGPEPWAAGNYLRLPPRGGNGTTGVHYEDEYGYSDDDDDWYG